MKDLAKNENQSFWNRGVMPRVADTEKDEPQEKTFFVGQQSWDAEGEKIQAFVDGSGLHPDPRIRRCGWGVSWLNQGGHSKGLFRGGCFGSIGSEVHSVAKAELEALIRALRHIDWQKQGMIVFSDCRFVVNGFKNKVWLKQASIAHRDRWLEVAGLLQGRDDVEVVWVKAHITPIMQEVRRVNQATLNGNETADALAKRGARAVQISQGTKAKILRLEATAWKIRRRLMAIQRYMVENHAEDQRIRLRG